MHLSWLFVVVLSVCCCNVAVLFGRNFLIHAEQDLSSLFSKGKDSKGATFLRWKDGLGDSTKEASLFGRRYLLSSFQVVCRFAMMWKGGWVGRRKIRMSQGIDRWIRSNDSFAPLVKFLDQNIKLENFELTKSRRIILEQIQFLHWEIGPWPWSREFYIGDRQSQSSVFHLRILQPRRHHWGWWQHPSTRMRQFPTS